MDKKFSRRRFLNAMGLAGIGAVLGACAPQPTEVEKVVTQVVQEVVKETVIVEGEVKEVTKVVEKVVTPTAQPNIVTPQGRELPADAAPLEKQVLYIQGDRGEPKHLDVARDMYSSACALHFGCEPLCWRDENMELKPAQAESWEAGPDATYWDFHLRKDNKWSDGEPITADDWVFSFQHMSDPELDNPWSWYIYDIKGTRAYKEGTGKREDVGVEKIDDYTVRFHGESGSVPHLPSLLAMMAMVPTPKHIAENDKQHWSDENHVSSSPWKLAKWEHNQRMEWDINPYYTGPWKAGVQRVVEFLVGSNWFNAWLNCEIDLMGVGTTEVARMRTDPKLSQMLHFYPNFQTSWLAFHTMRPPLDNKKVRQAICHALDRETYCNTVILGTQVPAYTLLPPNFPGYSEDLKSYQEYNVELAQQLLAEAGYPEGKDASGNQLTIKAEFSGAPGALGEWFKDQLETNLGIKVELVSMDGPTWSQKRSEHDLEVFAGAYEYDYMDPANFLGGIFRSTSEKGSNYYSWVNKEFDDLVTEAGSIADEAERYKLYKEAETILVDEAPAAFISHGLVFMAWWPYVGGIPVAKASGVEEFRGLGPVWNQIYMRQEEAEYREEH
jgi:oligopeptide transport system substrate-binding protein